MTERPKLISVADAAEMIGISKRAMYNVTEIVPALESPRVYFLEDIQELKKRYYTTDGNQNRRYRAKRG